MLRELWVSGLGVLTDVAVPFGRGLNVVTGETGAGKTLLVTSLALLTGARADSRLVGGAHAHTEAAFAATPAVAAQLRERGLDEAEELVVARRIGRDGRSRAWLAGTLVPASALADVMGGFVEIHGQQEAFALARPQTQLDALDTFSGASELRERFREVVVRRRALQAELAKVRASERERERTIDTLRYHLAEIEGARVDPETDSALASQLARLEHAERLSEIASEAHALAGAEGAAGSLGQAAKLLEEAAGVDPAFRALAERARALSAEAAELASDARAASGEADADPARLEALRERHGLLRRLMRRYGDSLVDVLEFAASTRETLAELEGADERAAGIEAQLEALRPEADALASELSALRSRGAEVFAAKVASELPSLALTHASFTVRVEPGPETENGRDAVSFLFSANQAMPPGPIGRVASGGELSRAMIAVSLALARPAPERDLRRQGAGTPGVLVFDEADQGVGGQAALDLGRRLARLGRTYQVLVVTHLAQIAAFADHHVVVRKSDGAVSVCALDASDREAEISRMLSGLESSDRARAHAAELLALAEAERTADAKVRDVSPNGGRGQGKVRAARRERVRSAERDGSGA